ncbi:unnamed protein product [Lasius platythorax]|uniref:Uncharacterized protein n=1 Tax=Lasius platythorax TaxID=488582 RepID=A0AAV2MX85_9HYME
MKLREAQATLRIAKGQVEDAKRRMEGLRLQIEQIDREERRVELKYQLQEEDRRLIYLICNETEAERKLEELRRGVDPESPDELLKSDSSISS